MDFTALHKQLINLTALVERWEEQGYVPDIELDIARRRLGDLYEVLLDASPRAAKKESTPFVAEQQNAEQSASLTAELEAGGKEETVQEEISTEQEEIVCQADQSDIEGGGEVESEVQEEAIHETEQESEVQEEAVHETEQKSEVQEEAVHETEQESEMQEEAVHETEQEESAPDQHAPAVEPTAEPATEEPAVEAAAEPATEEQKPETDPPLLSHDEIYATALFRGDTPYYRSEVGKMLAMATSDDVIIYITESYDWSADDATVHNFIGEMMEKFN